MLVKINEYEWINPLNIEKIQLLEFEHKEELGRKVKIYELIIRFSSGKVSSYEFKDKKEAEKIIYEIYQMEV